MKENIRLIAIILCGGIVMVGAVTYASTSQAQTKYHPVVEYIRNSKCPCSEDGRHEFRVWGGHSNRNDQYWFYCVYCIAYIQNQDNNGLTTPAGVAD